VPKEEALRRGAAVSHDIVYEVLAHMAQYLDSAVAEELLGILKQNVVADEPEQNISKLILKLSKEKARQYYRKIAQYAPVGKVLEAFARYQHDVNIEGENLIVPTPPKTISVMQECSQVHSSGKIDDSVHDHQYERRTTSSSQENQILTFKESKCSKRRKQIQNLTDAVDELKK